MAPTPLHFEWMFQFLCFLHFLNQPSKTSRFVKSNVQQKYTNVLLAILQGWLCFMESHWVAFFCSLTGSRGCEAKWYCQNDVCNFTFKNRVVYIRFVIEQFVGMAFWTIEFSQKCVIVWCQNLKMSSEFAKFAHQFKNFASDIVFFAKLGA